MNHAAVIELSPGRVALRPTGDRALFGARAQHAAAPVVAERWGAWLDEAFGIVAEWIGSGGIGSGSVGVVYSAPSTVCRVVSLPSALRGRTLERAGELSLAETTPYPLASALRSVIRLGDNADGRSAQVLCVADTITSVTSIITRLRACGLRPGWVIPVEALLTLGAVQDVTGLSDHGSAAVLRMDEQVSVLAAANGRRLRAVRVVSMGLDSIAHTLERSIALEPPASPVTLDRDAARALMERMGVPGVSDTIDAYPGLKGRHVLPLVQPAIQRIAIEIKQTLRFTMPDEERASTQLTLTGIGRGIPGLRDALAQRAGLESSDADATTPDAPRRDDVAALLRSVRARTVDLAGQLEDPASTQRRVRQAVWVGGALAALGVTYSTVAAHLELTDLRGRVSAARRVVESSAGAVALDGALTGAEAARTTLLARTEALAGGQPDLGALLGALGEVTPEAVRLRQIDFSETLGQPMVRLGAHADAGEDQARVLISNYLEVLRSLPIVKSVRLVSAERSDDGDELGFEIVVEADLVGLRAPELWGSASPSLTHAPDAEGTP